MFREPLPVDPLHRIGACDELVHPRAELIAGNVVAATREQQRVECPVLRIAQIFNDALALRDAEHLRGDVAVMRQIEHERPRRAVGLDPSDRVARQRIVEPGVALRENVERDTAAARLQRQALEAAGDDRQFVLGNLLLAIVFDLSLHRLEGEDFGIDRCHRVSPHVIGTLVAALLG